MYENDIRVWDAQNKAMIYPTSYCFGADAESNGHSRVLIFTEDGLRKFPSFMRSTFNHDCKGNLVFECDILKSEDERLWVVIFDCGGLSVISIEHFNSKYNELVASPCNDIQTFSWIRDCEVVGNIYQTKLEVK